MSEMSDSGTAPEHENWIDLIRRNLDNWSSEPSVAAADRHVPDEIPDLYSFYSELCAFRTEMAKTVKRQHETNARTSAALERFEAFSGRIESIVAESMASKNALVLAELAVRLERLSQALDLSVPRRFLGERKRWEEWASSLRTAFSIVYDHYEALLERSGIRRIEVCGIPFNPHTMVAVDVVESASEKDETVIEEISPGFVLGDRTLKLAEVKVARSTRGAC